MMPVIAPAYGVSLQRVPPRKTGKGLFARKEFVSVNTRELAEQLDQRRDGHDQHENVADGHADPQGCGGLVALVHILAPDEQSDEQTCNGGGHGGAQICQEDQLGGRAAIAVADDRAEGQADHAADPHEFGF